MRGTVMGWLVFMRGAVLGWLCMCDMQVCVE